MLEPKYLEDLPEGVIELYSKVEQDILSDMARRLMAYDYWLDSSIWQEQKLKEVGVLHDDIVTAMAGITGKSRTEIRKVMREACTRALKADGRTYAAAGLAVPDFNSSKALKNTLNAGLKSTLGTFKNLTGTTANTASRQFEDALDKAWLKVKSGAFSTDTAVRDAIKELSAAGVGAITYPSGRVDTLETAVRRAIVTGVNKTAGEVQWQLADEMGCDLVQVTAHGGARPEHAAWQGGIYSRSGKSRKYKDFKETTGYGTGAGLCGWNCRHSFGPYIEGAPKAYSDKMLENYNAEKYEYNGQKMTEYEASQKQREIERNIRRWKRENKAMEAAGLDTSESAEKVKYWQARQRDFVRQTGLKRQYSREQIGALVTGRNAISGINTPLISTAENREKRYLENVLSGKVRLNRRHKDIIRQIPSKGDWTYMSTDKVELKDLAALTAATKDEFALFTGRGKALVVHGGTHWNLPESAWKEIEANRLVWVGHSHPTTVNVRASIEDRRTLRMYFTWQEESAIIDMKGKVHYYTGSEQDWINKILGVR